MASLRYPNVPILNDKMDWFRVDAYNYDAQGSGIGISTNTNPLLTSGLGTLLDSVFLPMPSNIQDGNSVNYGEDSLNSLTAGGLNAVSNVMGADYSSSDITGSLTKIGNTLSTETGKFFNSIGNNNIKNLVIKGLAAEAVSIFGGNITLNSFLARESGQILNPNMELLFNGVTLRTFRFSFKMTPRDNDESANIKAIIRFLKKNMAAKTGTSNTFLETPSIFDLSYRKGTGKHPFLHSFKPCFLKDMSVNYTGENVYATYADGTPVSISMDLTFQEVEPIYAKDYTDDLVGVGY